MIYTQDVSSGRVHKRVRVGKSLATLEACNQDDAGAAIVLTPVEVEAVEADAFCQRCFPSETSA